MLTRLSACAVTLTCAGLLPAAVIDTVNATTAAAFQAGATVVNFENVAGRTAMPITSYAAGQPLSPAAIVFKQIPGVQFSVGGTPGTNGPSLFQLTSPIPATDAHSPTTVFGPASMDGKATDFGGFIEVYFPSKVSKVGFWLNPSLGNVAVTAFDRANPTFTGNNTDPQKTLDTATFTAGHFVGFQEATASIEGVTINPLDTTKGFTLDDLTFGAGTASTTVPEPATFVLIGFGLAGIVASRRRR